MAVLSCPLCGFRVNADAGRCPECGADPHLQPEQAWSELLARSGPPSVSLASRSRPGPGWRWSWRIVAAVAALLGPLWLLALAIVLLVRDVRDYFALPLAVRGSGGGLFSPDAAVRLDSLLVAACVLVVLTAVSVALPRRLNVWWGVAVSVVMLTLTSTLWPDAAISDPGHVSAPLLMLLSVPSLVAIRLGWQWSRRGRPARGGQQGVRAC